MNSFDYFFIIRLNKSTVGYRPHHVWEGLAKLGKSIGDCSSNEVGTAAVLLVQSLSRL